MRILCHNTLWFQGAPYDGDSPEEPLPAVLEALTNLYKTWQPHVVCLQEIPTAEVACEVGEALGMQGAYSPGLRYEHYGVATYSIWPMEALETPLLETDRAIQQVTVNAPKRLLRLANVDLPSSRQRGREGGARRRLGEMRALLRLGEDAPNDCILGDFSELPDGPCSRLLEKAHYIDAAVKGRQGSRPSTLGGSRVDHIWLAARLGTQLRRYHSCASEDLVTEAKGKTHLSDHLPIGVELHWTAGATSEEA